ncbi:carboxypeptidase-like regulatory domain-containing protein [Micromonospora sp. NBC_01699]|uniref:carboxypeptidase-like regulatory domain-containing protein n=1 Tax=Micromonospora sp. NBC_01699 TaxID=2975984 RepID=UPI002E32500A|nr:carboxypeptidase-like regulatory domain-containing protein [Micromonospora sp. NBC_01699]
MRSTRTRVLVSAVFVVAVLSACAQPADAPGAAGGPGGDSPISASDPPADSGQATNRGTVTGRVRAADGSPLAGVAVHPKSLDNPANAIPELLVTTDEAGTFRWTLAPGRYEFQAQPPAGSTITGRAAPQTATVTLGQTATVDFTLG